MDWIKRLREANTGTIIVREKDALARKYQPKFKTFFNKQRDVFLRQIDSYKDLFPERAWRSALSFRLIEADRQFRLSDFETAWAATEQETNAELQKLIIETESEAMIKGSQIVDQFFIDSEAKALLGKTSFTLDNPRAVAWFSQHGGSLSYIKDIQGTSKDQLQTLITQSLDEGWSYNQTAKEIKSKFSDMSTNRAKLIAQNEAAQAYEAGNRGFIDGLSDLGVVMVKKWMNSEDDKVSAGCKTNTAAGWIPLNQAFPSGHQHPTRHPKCRCYTIYEAAEDIETQ